MNNFHDDCTCEEFIIFHWGRLKPEKRKLQLLPPATSQVLSLILWRKENVILISFFDKWCQFGADVHFVNCNEPFLILKNIDVQCYADKEFKDLIGQ